MYVDGELLFSDAAAVATGSSLSTFVDLKRAGEDIGNGQPIYLVAVLVANSVTGIYTEPDNIIDVQFVSATDGVGSGLAVHATAGTLPANGKEGESICIALPATFGSQTEVQQFIGVQYQSSSTPTTNIDAFLTTTPQKYKAYPKSYTIS